MSSAASTTALSADDRVVIHNVPWETYSALRDDLCDHAIRLTYDGSNLEIMSPSRDHERVKMVLAGLLTLLSYELKIPMLQGGSLTCRRADVARGLEPGVCYWIASASQISAKGDVDLETSPPPDLAIEIDISPSRLDRPKIYAALGIPELWRYDGEQIHVELLQADGTYRTSDASLSFPFLPVQELARFVAMGEHHGESESQWMFVDWLREQNFK